MGSEKPPPFTLTRKSSSLDIPWHTGEIYIFGKYKFSTSITVQNGTCPQGGDTLEIEMAIRGNKVGQDYMGYCEFPDCRFDVCP